MAERSEQVDKHLIEGERLMQNQFYDRSMVEFNKALKLDSKATISALEGLFKEANASGNYDGVISIGSNMLIYQPDNATLANLLGNSYRKMGNLAQAQKLYEHCLKYNPDDKYASNNLAAALAHVDLFDGNAIAAISPFETMTSPKLPDNKEGELKLKNIQRQIIATEETEEEEGEGGEDWQDSLETELSSQETEKKKKEPKIIIVPDEILTYLRKDKTMGSKEHYQVLRYLAIYCIENNFAEVSWRASTRLVFKDPKNEDIQSFMALTYSLRDEEELAINKLIELLGENPYNRYANANLGYLYLKQKKTVLAKKYFILTHHYLEKSKGYYDMDAFRELGEKYYQDEIYKNAQKVFEVLAEENVTPEILNRLGQIHLALEDFAPIIEIYKKIMKEYYHQPEVKKMMEETNSSLLKQTNILMTGHKYSRAVQLYEISMEINPTKSVIEDALTAYKLLRDDENIERMMDKMRALEKLEKEQELEQSRLDKIKEAKQFVKKNHTFKAIQAYEEALRLKPDKDILIKLVTLYKKTRQNDMIEDVTDRYNKMIERAQRLAELEEEQQANQ